MKHSFRKSTYRSLSRYIAPLCRLTCMKCCTSACSLQQYTGIHILGRHVSLEDMADMVLERFTVPGPSLPQVGIKSQKSNQKCWAWNGDLMHVQGQAGVQQPFGCHCNSIRQTQTKAPFDTQTKPINVMILIWSLCGVCQEHFPVPAMSRPLSKSCYVQTNGFKYTYNNFCHALLFRCPAACISRPLTWVQRCPAWSFMNRQLFNSWDLRMPRYVLHTMVATPSEHCCEFNNHECASKTLKKVSQKALWNANLSCFPGRTSRASFRYCVTREWRECYPLAHGFLGGSVCCFWWAAIHCACNGKWLPALRSSRLAKTRKGSLLHMLCNFEEFNQQILWKPLL